MSLKKSSNATDLRQRALARLNSVTTAEIAPRSAIETQRLLHELQVHQIQLEMQNEDLLHARTELEEVLLCYTDLYDFAPVGYVSVNRAGHIVQANFAGARLLGSKRAVLPGRPLAGFVAKADVPCLNALIRQVFAAQPAQTIELDLIDPRALLRAVQIEAALSPDEQTCGMSMMDITDRRLLDEARHHEATLKVDRQAADAASQAKSTFISRMSHELRTPLNAILGYTQLLRMDEHRLLDEMQCQRLDAVLLAGQHLLQLIEDVLALSEIESGASSIEMAPTSVQEVLDEALQAVASDLGSSGVSVIVEKPLASAAQDVSVHANRHRLVQVVVNLLSNAIKYNAADGEVRLTVDATRSGLTCIAVADTGVGMTQAQLACMFEPFNRLGQEQSGIPGTGIGLVITKWLVNMMGGSLLLQSEPGKGSRFEVCLPSHGS